MMKADHDGLIDFHAHLLPGADHGSNSVQTSLKQLKLLKKNGVSRVVATPHFYPSSMTVEGFTAKTNQALLRLTTHFNANPDASISGLSFMVGAEVLACEEIDKMDGLESLTIRGTNTLLVEMPFSKWTDELLDSVKKLTQKNFDVVLAHIDRYPFGMIEELLDLDLTCQINPWCLISLFTRKKYIELIKNGSIQAIGSDIHGPSPKEAKALANAYRIMGKHCQSQIIEGSKMLLNGAYIEHFGINDIQ